MRLLSVRLFLLLSLSLWVTTAIASNIMRLLSVRLFLLLSLSLWVTTAIADQTHPFSIHDMLAMERISACWRWSVSPTRKSPRTADRLCSPCGQPISKATRAPPTCGSSAQTEPTCTGSRRTKPAITVPAGPRTASRSIFFPAGPIRPRRQVGLFSFRPVRFVPGLANSNRRRRSRASNRPDPRRGKSARLAGR